MRLSRVGILIVILSIILVGTNCSSYNRLITRRNLVDGAQAYKDRKFAEAEAFFRKAVEIDPEAKTDEGKTARLFLARTIHSQYVGSRNYELAPTDFKDPQRPVQLVEFIRKLSAKADPVSEFLYGKLRPETQQLLGQVFDSLLLPENELANEKKENIKQFVKLFFEDLNTVIKEESIYDQNRFSKVTLSDFTKEYLAKQPTGSLVVRLNRLLLEDAYPEIIKRAKPEDAIKLYRASVADNLTDQSSYNAVANLYETLGGQFPEERDKWMQEWEKWTTERADNTNVASKYRADAYASLASKQYSCANEISEAEAVKKTVKKDGKDVFQFTKPENPADYEKFTQCIQKGVELIDKGVALEDDEARNGKTAEIKPLKGGEMAKLDESVKIWAKVWSYKSSLMNQSLRWAEMDNRMPEKDAFKLKADEARAKFLEYIQVEKKIETEKEERARAADPATANTSNANTGK